jgi:ubiquinone/menaquinone biosynthesis C-methylase UbiE
MVVKTDQPNYEGKDKFTPFTIWEKGGLTEHLGGIYATRRLLTRCHLTAGQQILDVGCGTGFTACDLAMNYQVQIVALDINPRSITEARKRISKQNANRQVRVVRADAHRPPLSDAIFDTVIIESVLVFCDAAAVIAEIRRVLKPGGIVGVNEFTFLKSPPARLVSLLTSTMGIHTFRQDTWESILRSAGFAEVSSSVHRINLWEQLTSHLESDGVKNYLAAMVVGVSDTSIRRTFFNKEMLVAARDFLPYVGYGLYTGRKTVEEPFRA